MTNTYIISQIFTILGIILLGSSYLCKSKRQILILTLLSSICYGGHNFLLGAITGVAMNIVTIITSIWLYINEKSKKETSLIFLITISLLIIILGILSYQNIFSLLPIIASLLFTYSIWQNNNKVYRWIGLSTSVMWLSYNAYLSSIMGMFSEIILLGFKVVGVIKTIRNKSKHYMKVLFGDESRYKGGSYKYKIGQLNIADYWNTEDTDNLGGFNFSTEDKIARWLVRGDTLYDVIIPEGSEVIEIKSESSPNGVFRTNKIILTNPRKVTDVIALELYKKSNLPEKSYFEMIAGYALRGYINSAQQIIKDKINKENLDLAIKDYERYYKGNTQEEKDNYNKILSLLKALKF